jgi:hypothetical protein
MSDIREFPMDIPKEIEIRPLDVWPFLEAEWARQREQEAADRILAAAILSWLEGNPHVAE